MKVNYVAIYCFLCAVPILDSGTFLSTCFFAAMTSLMHGGLFIDLVLRDTVKGCLPSRMQLFGLSSTSILLNRTAGLFLFHRCSVCLEVSFSTVSPLAELVCSGH